VVPRRETLLGTRPQSSDRDAAQEIAALPKAYRAAETARERLHDWVARHTPLMFDVTSETSGPVQTHEVGLALASGTESMVLERTENHFVRGWFRLSPGMRFALRGERLALDAAYALWTLDLKRAQAKLRRLDKLDDSRERRTLEAQARAEEIGQTNDWRERTQTPLSWDQPPEMMPLPASTPASVIDSLQLP
jgi:hypothetical protein